jgi:3-carboxy-cis,cis-muconate cycloisomerase
LPDLARMTGGALAQITTIVSGLEVDTDRLAANLATTQGLILGEAVMLALGDAIGRLEAHALVEHASKEAVASGHTLFDILSRDTRVTNTLPAERLRALLDPAHYMGQAHAFVDAVLDYKLSGDIDHG